MTEIIAEEFQKELNSITDTRPPISKAKMNSIIKCALKFHKFYKYIVYYVECFIKTCSNEYKIAGLYVIDAIIRNTKTKLQNNLFEMRFEKNLYKTFVHIYRCIHVLSANAGECDREKEKVLKVLNLWKLNNIFTIDLVDKLIRLSKKDFSLLNCSNNNNNNSSLNEQNDEIEDNFDDDYGRPQSGAGNGNGGGGGVGRDGVKLNNSKNKNDDYDEDEVSRIKENSERLKNSLTTCSAWILAHNSKNQDQNKTESQTKPPHQQHQQAKNFNTDIVNMDVVDMNEDSNSSQNGNGHLNGKNKFHGPDLTKPPPAIAQPVAPAPTVAPLSLPQLTNQQYQMFSNILQQSQQLQQQQQQQPLSQLPPNGFQRVYLQQQPPPQPQLQQLQSASDLIQNNEFLNDYDNRNTNGNSKQSIHFKYEQDRSRRKDSLPPLKDDHLCICSKTLWIGHLSKSTTDDDLSSLLEAYGKILDIHMIPPRGCAYILFSERRDAARCLDKMKDSRVQGSYIKIAWATNKGIKDKNKQYWNSELGCTYIPVKELIANDVDLKLLSEGGLIDDESIRQLPFELRSQFSPNPQPEQVDGESESVQSVAVQQQEQPPQPPLEAIMTATQLPLHLQLQQLQEHKMNMQMPLLQQQPPPPPTATTPQQQQQQQQHQIQMMNENSFLEQLQQQQHHLHLQQQQAQQQQQQNGLQMLQQQAQNAMFLNQIRANGMPSAHLQGPPVTGPGGQLLNGHHHHLIAAVQQGQSPQGMMKQQQHPGIQTLQLSNLNGVPLQVIQGGLAHHPRFQIAGPHGLQILSRPLIGGEHLISSNGMIRHLIPSQLLQQFSSQPEDMNLPDRLNNQSQVQLVRIPQGQLNQGNPLAGLQLRHLTPTPPSPSQPPSTPQLQPQQQQQQQQLPPQLAIFQQQQQQRQQQEIEQFNSNQNNFMQQAVAAAATHSNRPFQPPPQQQQQIFFDSNVMPQRFNNTNGNNPRFSSNMNDSKNRVSRFDRDWSKQADIQQPLHQTATPDTTNFNNTQPYHHHHNHNQQTNRMPIKRPYNQLFNNNRQSDYNNKPWKFNNNNNNGSREFRFNNINNSQHQPYNQQQHHFQHPPLHQHQQFYTNNENNNLNVNNQFWNRNDDADNDGKQQQQQQDAYPEEQKHQEEEEDNGTDISAAV